jgi:tetratricopeptide (TPR) repeat protein
MTVVQPFALRKIALTLLVTCLAVAGCDNHAHHRKGAVTPGGPEGDADQALMGETIPIRTTLAGDFLDSHFAQSQYDWGLANDYLAPVLAQEPGNAELLKRSMILAVGSGDMSRASERAQDVLKVEPKNGLALLVLSVDALANDRMADAEKDLNMMPEGDLTSFVKPLILGWIKAGQGQLDIHGFNDTTIHLYHGAAMALMLGKVDEARDLTRKMIETGGLGTYDAERAGDLLAAEGQRDDALTIYKSVAAQTGGSAVLNAKIAALEKNDGSIKDMLTPLKIKTPQQGAALAMYDMAFVLYQEDSDTSAKIFAQMALVLNPQMIDGQILMGDILARNGQAAEAIKYFEAIPKDNLEYAESQRHAADLLAASGHGDEARSLLRRMYDGTGDVDALIRIGDLYRQDEQYQEALDSYNEVAKRFNGPVPGRYWYLLYARGMTYERLNQWPKAEDDLKAAIAAQPDNPYLLNYLGYGWADRGVHMDEALDMVQKAATLKPNDGYITDSLGWTYYKMGRYDDAVTQLERGVELLPYDPTVNDHLGDAYWRVGRQDEARYQWQRAANNAGPEDGDLKKDIEKKLKDGLPAAKDKAAVAPTSQ